VLGEIKINTKLFMMSCEDENDELKKTSVMPFGVYGKKYSKVKCSGKLKKE